jgi:hypothetical protein
MGNLSLFGAILSVLLYALLAIVVPVFLGVWAGSYGLRRSRFARALDVHIRQADANSATLRALESEVRGLRVAVEAMQRGPASPPDHA